MATQLGRSSARKSFAGLAAVTTLVLAYALAPVAGASAAETVTFGIDFAAAGDPALAILDTEANVSGTSSALPAGMTVPHDGTITGWRIEVAGSTATEALQFRVIRGTTSIYLGPSINFASTGTPFTSRTIAENVPVKQGDLIGLTKAGGSNIAVAYQNSFNGAAVIGNKTSRWYAPYGETETKNVGMTFSGYSVAIQADLSFTPPPPPPPPAMCAGLPATITGTDGPDVIVGTAGNDVIAALGGNDVVRADAGDDIVCGGAGKDKLIGGPGKDTLSGDAGRGDVCKGKGGRDRLKRSCEMRIQ